MGSTKGFSLSNIDVFPCAAYSSLSRPIVSSRAYGPIDEPPGPLPIRITQNEPYVPITDGYLISLLEPRFRADDVVGYGRRARELERVFGNLTLIEAVPLLVRLLSRKVGDRVAMLFHGHLATATRAKLISVLRVRLTK